MDLKSVALFATLFFALNLVVMVAVPAFSQSGETDDASKPEIAPCSLVAFDTYCSPSGWMSFILGDIIIAILLALLLRFLSKKTYQRIVEASEHIDTIISREAEAKRRLLVYNSQSLKNTFSILLMNMGLMNMALAKAKTYEDVPKNIREYYADIEFVLNRAYNTIGFSVEVLDPLLVEEIQAFLLKFENIKPESGVGKGFPDYDKTKEDIQRFSDKLDKAVATNAESV